MCRGNYVEQDWNWIWHMKGRGKNRMLRKCWWTEALKVQISPSSHTLNLLRSQHLGRWLLCFLVMESFKECVQVHWSLTRLGLRTQQEEIWLHKGSDFKLSREQWSLESYLGLLYQKKMCPGEEMKVFWLMESIKRHCRLITLHYGINLRLVILVNLSPINWSPWGNE